MSTSTLSSNDICARVRARWIALAPESVVARADHNIALVIPGACERLARAVKDTTDRLLLTTEITNKVPAAGKLNLSAVDYAGLLIDTLRLPGAITTYAPSNVVFNHVPSLDGLRAPSPVDPTCVWYHLRGTQLVFKNPEDGALTTYATAVNLSASYIPDLGTGNLPLPAELNDQLIDRVAEIVKEMGGLPFLQMDPEKAATVVRGR